MFRFGGNNAKVNNSEYYDILGVDKQCSQKDVKKSYHKLAKKYHPDKAPDDKKEEYTQKFQKINEAYEILANEEKRSVYDKYGKEGLKGQNGINVNFSDIFSNVFGSQFNTGFNTFNTGFNTNFNTGFNNGFNAGFNTSHGKKSKPVVHKINISLEDMFIGKHIKLKISRKTIFSKNTSKPWDESNINLNSTWTVCKTCNGKGFNPTVSKIGTGMVCQSQKMCQECSGSGCILKENYYMNDCDSIVEIDYKGGYDASREIVLKGMGNCHPGAVPGDIVILLMIRAHDKFMLSGKNLIYVKNISLKDALCGSEFKIKMLNGDDYKVKTNKIITPNHVEVVKGKGMIGLRKDFGDLHIKYNVIFPTSLNEKQKKTLSNVLKQ